MDALNADALPHRLRSRDELADRWGLGPDLPPESPLTMPVQSLRDARERTVRAATSPPRVRLRRAALWGGVLAVTLLGSWRVFAELGADTFGPLDLPILTVFALLFAWSALAFFTACAGLVEILRRRRPLDIDPAGPLPRLTRRTAVLAPIYNETPHQVLGRLEAMCEQLAGLGAARSFDVFILSDSNGPGVRAQEASGFAALRRRLGDGVRVYYRRRAARTDRKAGNIAEWVRRFGGAYDFMVVLDADSLVSGETLVRLAAAMETHPGVGVIQTLPLVVGHSSLFGRAQQFASRLYGPLIAHGIAWWSGAEGNYWGHNAIVRVAAFAGEAGLPHLPGPAPLGGSILSHDFVEAALMRRGGWAVHIAPQLGGSYEGSPPSLADLIKRDRRWCQGNLQHLGVLASRGLHGISRFHLITGVFAYVTAPLWLALVTLNLILDANPALGEAAGAPASARHAGGHAAPWTFLAVLLFFLAPRAFAFVLAMSDPTQRAGFGGAWRAAAGLVVETLISALVTPVVMVSQVCALCGLVLGRDCGWKPQSRSDAGLDVDAAMAGHLPHTLIGLTLATAAWLLARHSALWLAPVLPSLLLAVPIADLLSRRDVGDWARRHGLLATPEEAAPPAVVARADALAEVYGAAASVRPGPIELIHAAPSHTAPGSLAAALELAGAITTSGWPEAADRPAAG